MKVTCDSCGATFKIPPKKLPHNQVVSLTCPKCKGKITVDTRDKDRVSKYTGIFGQDDSSLELFEEGTRLALVLHDDDKQIDGIISSLEELSYKPVVPSARDAMGKLRLHHFDLIILSDGFDGQNLEDSPVTNYLNHLSMNSRRKIFLALISDKFKTMDNMMAFTLSANLVINPADLSKLHLILTKAIHDHEKFYKIFTDALKEKGKD
ncbi:MAG: zinc-ribbon domain-containing protein [Thermodesulfobacteriota bacterium]